MALLTFDHLYTYAELTSALEALVAARPDLISVESIGRSHEGRDVWLATITNTATGPHDEKPAIWVGANIHSVEHTGAVAALHLAHLLVTEYANDPRITHLLDTRTVYVVPRVNPDGAELALASPPQYIRSSTRPWPRADQQPGLVESDVDGDGRLLNMRVPDPNGAWKISDRDPRLLVARAPDDFGAGPYYRLLFEGTIEQYDGALVPVAAEWRGLDLNRQFPSNWRHEGEQHGAGPFPLSEPETRIIAEAASARSNICCYFCHHTFSAAILRPYDDRSDDAFATADLKRYNVLGAKGQELTGYRHVGVWNDFRYDPKDIITGGEDSWAFDHLGAFAWTTEFWSPLPHAGITDFHLINWFADHPIDDDLALLRYSDEQCGGQGFVDWYPFEHPQLGPVEIGGWDPLRFWFNPPDDKLEAEVAPHSQWQIFCGLSTPRLRVRETAVEALGDRLFRVRVVVENEGWLPTNVSERAIEKKLVRGIEATISVPDGVSLRSERALVELGQLAGRSHITTMTADFGFATDGTPDRTKVEWIVEGDAGSAVDVVVRHQRAGVARAAITLA